MQFVQVKCLSNFTSWANEAIIWLFKLLEPIKLGFAGFAIE